MKVCISFLLEASIGLRVLSLPASVCPSVHFIAATAIKPPKAACQFAADDILLYEFCYYNPVDLLHHLEKGKEELSPLQYHIKSLHIISRHYKKSLLRSQIYHGYEELSTDTNYPIWRRQERRSKYAVQLASWQLRSNSPKTSVSPSVTKFVRTIIHHPFKLGSPNLDHRCNRPWLRSLLFLGLIELDMSNLTYFQNPVYLMMKTESVPHPEMASPRQAKVGYEKYSLHVIFTFYLDRDTLYFNKKRFSVLTYLYVFWLESKPSQKIVGLW